MAESVLDGNVANTVAANSQSSASEGEDLLVIGSTGKSVAVAFGAPSGPATAHSIYASDAAKPQDTTAVAPNMRALEDAVAAPGGGGSGYGAAAGAAVIPIGGQCIE